MGKIRTFWTETNHAKMFARHQGKNENPSQRHLKDGVRLVVLQVSKTGVKADNVRAGIRLAPAEAKALREWLDEWLFRYGHLPPGREE